MSDEPESPTATPAEQAVLKALDAYQKRETKLAERRRAIERANRDDLGRQTKSETRALIRAQGRVHELQDALDPAACQHTRTRAVMLCWSPLPGGRTGYHSGALECLACGARNFEIQTRWVHPEKERRARLEGKTT